MPKNIGLFACMGGYEVVRIFDPKDIFSDLAISALTQAISAKGVIKILCNRNSHLNIVGCEKEDTYEFWVSVPGLFDRKYKHEGTEADDVANELLDVLKPANR